MNKLHVETLLLLRAVLIHVFFSLPATLFVLFPREEKRPSQDVKSSAETGAGRERERKRALSPYRTRQGRRSGEMDYIESAADFIIRSTEYPFVVGPSLRPPGFPFPAAIRGGITFIRTLLINDKI